MDSYNNVEKCLIYLVKITLFLKYAHVTNLYAVLITFLGDIRTNDTIYDMTSDVDNPINKPLTSLVYLINLITLHGYRLLLSPTLKASNKINPNISETIIEISS